MILKKKKKKKIHAYRHYWPLQHFRLDFHLDSQTNYFGCVNFICEWQDSQLTPPFVYVHSHACLSLMLIVVDLGVRCICAHTDSCWCCWWFVCNFLEEVTFAILPSGELYCYRLYMCILILVVPFSFMLVVIGLLGSCSMFDYVSLMLMLLVVCL